MAPLLEDEWWSMLEQDVGSSTFSLTDKATLVGLGLIAFGIVASVLLVVLACACGKGEGEDTRKDGKGDKKSRKITIAKSVVILKSEGGLNRFEGASEVKKTSDEPKRKVDVAPPGYTVPPVYVEDDEADAKMSAVTKSKK